MNFKNLPLPHRYCGDFVKIYRCRAAMDISAALG
jgi:hypothetical protein